jgi:hypothetical protein
MEKDPINKDATEQDLEKIFDGLLDLEKEIKSEIKKIFENETRRGRLYKGSHFIFSIANRAIALNRGYYVLVKANNYVTAIALIRLQIDNCLRLYAMTLVDDPRDFYEKVLGGSEVRDLVDRDGKKMTDNYLVTKLDELFPKFKLLYKNTSGFVHFSNEHFFLNNTVTDMGENSFRLRTSIGDIDRLEIYEQVDYGFNMFMTGKNLFKLIKGYRVTMEKYLDEDE